MEAAIQAAYCMANTVDNLEELITQNDESKNKDFLSLCYKWFEKTYPKDNLIVKNLKNSINKSGTHASLVQAYQNLYTGEDVEPHTLNILFFDANQSPDLLKVNLWLIANIAIGVSNLILSLNQDHNVFELRSNVEMELESLGQENDQFKRVIENSQWYQELLDLFCNKVVIFLSKPNISLFCF